MVLYLIGMEQSALLTATHHELTDYVNSSISYIGIPLLSLVGLQGRASTSDAALQLSQYNAVTSQLLARYSQPVSPVFLVLACMPVA